MWCTDIRTSTGQKKPEKRQQKYTHRTFVESRSVCFIRARACDLYVCVCVWIGFANFSRLALSFELKLKERATWRVASCRWNSRTTSYKKKIGGKKNRDLFYFFYCASFNVCVRVSAKIQSKRRERESAGWARETESSWFSPASVSVSAVSQTLSFNIERDRAS